ncbi:DUF5522 domain-containing protein [Chryseobacterium sp. A301]
MSRLPIKENEDYYYNEQGYRVFTENYHLKRGFCCKNGCKHCPYGYDKKTDTFKKNQDKNKSK